MKKYYLALLLQIFIASAFSQKSIKVACVGNSVTYGYGISDKKYNYPSQLQRLLGNTYEVANFGKSGATLLRKGHRPYVQQEEYKRAIDFKADIVVIHLGLNDTDPRDWTKFRDDFISDYMSLIQDFKTANSNAKVYICLMTPIFTGHHRFKSSTREWYHQVQEAIKCVADNSDVELIDLNSSLRYRPDLFPDNLHPTREGAGIIAQQVYGHITGDFGGLKTPNIFGNHMVIQRGKPINIWGTANARTEVVVKFNHQIKKVIANNDGKWSVSFPKMSAGGSYNLEINNSGKNIVFSDIMIGDVWLCSGQSNMAFELKNSLNFNNEIEKVGISNLRFYKMSPIARTNNRSWDENILSKVNRLNYFNTNSWNKATIETISDFSAVGYYFGKQIQEKTNVPIGLIQNAVGGSPTEAWISRDALENDALLVDCYNHWQNNDFIDSWVRSRAKLNIKKSKNKLQQHPYKPSYLYAVGMLPIEKFSFAGVIWYQGESNANNVELHEKMLPLLVKDWRSKKGDHFPFYYVQLSSIGTKGRETWGYFRDSQRRLLKVIPNSGMAVSSDVGNKNDVHPKAKKQVGERLAFWALADYYGFDICKTGPLFRNAVFKDQKAIVYFEKDEKLMTSDDKNVRGFQLAGKNKIFYSATATIRNSTIIVESPKVKKARFVRYGWNSFSLGNLINQDRLPASTFSSEYGVKFQMKNGIKSNY